MDIYNNESVKLQRHIQVPPSMSTFVDEPSSRTLQLSKIRSTKTLRMIYGYKMIQRL